MSERSGEGGALVKIREWVDTEGRELNQWGYYDWPAPPEYTEYRVEGQMRADVLARLGRDADDPCEVRLIQGAIEGGYSEFTAEMDYTIEAWVDDSGQSQKVFDGWTYSEDSALAGFLKWLTDTRPTPPARTEP